MPLFEIANQELSAVEQSNFVLEKNLQSLIENNLQTIFNCRLVACGIGYSAKVSVEKGQKG